MLAEWHQAVDMLFDFGTILGVAWFLLDSRRNQIEILRLARRADDRSIETNTLVNTLVKEGAK